MKIQNLSLAVALLINSTSAIQLHKTSIKSEINHHNSVGVQSLTQASSTSGARVQMRQQLITDMESKIQSAQSNTNLAQQQAFVRAAHDDLASIAVNALEDKTCADADVPNLQRDVNEVSAQMPVLGALEKKLNLMKSLNPELKSLSKDLQEVADWDDMKLAKLGGRAIHSILDHAYPTGGYHDFGLDVDQAPSVKGILTKPADPLLPTSGVVGLLKAARPSQKIPLSMFPSSLDFEPAAKAKSLEGEKLIRAVDDLKDRVEDVAEKKSNKVDRKKLTKQVAEAAGRAIEKAGEKAAIVAKTNAPLAADMLKIAKKTAKEAATKALSEE